MANLVIGAILVVLIIWFFWRNLRQKGVTVDDDKIQIIKTLLNEHISYYQALNIDNQLRFEKMLDDFLADVNIEGVGLEITDTDRVMIAASAIIPIFGFPEWKYKKLTNILLYPDAFNNDFQFEGENNRNIMGMVGSGYMNGQMILSKAALVKGFSKNNGTENAAIHEFVHLIDGVDGAIDGTPHINDDHAYAGPWLQMMHQEIHRINEGKSDINPYATTSEAEFLAVTSEYFFEKPEKFKQEHPGLFVQLSNIFDQDPVTRGL